MYALIDCNNFYASCERLFRPDLRDKPIIVLSNNDGCVIARSNEAKALGIKMGVPYYEVKGICKQHKVVAFSSNYTLYGDLSQRVMSLIEEEWKEVEIYSIDEAFLDLRTMPAYLHDSFCIALQKKILKSTGIPTSIGIGQTKTLAKMANHICKKKLKISVYNVSQHREWLKKIDVGEVWGIGRQWHKKLVQQGVSTAYDLTTMNPHLLRKQFNIMLMRTAMELQGIACEGLEQPAPNKSIMSSRSFGEMQTELASIEQAISSHCARAYEKLRSQNLIAQYLYVFVRSNSFRRDLPQYNNGVQFKFIHATDDLRLITTIAKRCLKKIFKGGYYYKKAGICLEGLISKEIQQRDLFHQPSEEKLKKKDALMGIFDKINYKFGRHTLKLAAEGYGHPWAMRSGMRSPCYTTNWNQLPRIRNLT